jgi:hypothetical protein
MISTEISKTSSDLRKCASCKCKMLLSYFDTNKNTGQLKNTCRKCLEKNKFYNMKKYSNSIIYIICCKDEDITECYVGSTKNFEKRKSMHISVCDNIKDKGYNRPVYKYIRDHGGFDNWIFEKLQNYPCDNKKELLIRERYWFEKLDAKLNSCYPQRSKKEYRECEIVSELRKEYLKKWYQNNKQKIAEKGKEKVKCECGSIICIKHLSRHKKTKKHQNYILKEY